MTSACRRRPGRRWRGCATGKSDLLGRRICRRTNQRYVGRIPLAGRGIVVAVEQVVRVDLAVEQTVLEGYVNYVSTAKTRMLGVRFAEGNRISDEAHGRNLRRHRPAISGPGRAGTPLKERQRA